MSVDFLKDLLMLARDVVEAENEVPPVVEENRGKAALTELFEEVRNDATPVMAERVEHFRNKTNAVEPFDLPVVGVFEIADGKIKAWRDYWDRSAAEPLLRFIAMSRGQRTT